MCLRLRELSAHRPPTRERGSVAQGLSVDREPGFPDRNPGSALTRRVSLPYAGRELGFPGFSIAKRGAQEYFPWEWLGK